MKTKFLFALLITSLFTQAQVSDFLSGFNAPGRLIIDNNIIYVKETDKISQINLSDPSPAASVLYGNLPSTLEFVNLVKNGDILIVTYADADTFASTIASIDLSLENPVLVPQLTGLGFVHGLAVRNSELFFTEENLTTGVVSLNKLDITIDTAIIENVLPSGLTNPQDMEFNGNILYIGDSSSDQILAIDVTQANPTASVFLSNVNCRGVYVFNNFLYFSDAGVIKKVLISNPSNITTEATDTASNSDFLRDVVISGSNLYMPQESFGKIVTKEDLTLSIDNVNEQLKNVSIYNNKHQLSINGLTGKKHSVTIYSLSGSELITETINLENNSINISFLANGVYLINVDNKQVFKFIK